MHKSERKTIYNPKDKQKLDLNAFFFTILAFSESSYVNQAQKSFTVVSESANITLFFLFISSWLPHQTF